MVAATVAQVGHVIQRFELVNDELVGGALAGS